MDINNPSLQSITLINPIPKLVKIIKGGTSCGALALDANGIIYGCGKNKNQMFGSEFKNN
jgi:alpha-tubulin suppressor-like RCC1 family protein